MSTILRFSKIPLRTVRGYTTQLLFQQQRNVTAQSLSVSNERVRRNYNQPEGTVKRTNRKNIDTQRKYLTEKRPIELYISNIQKQVFNYDFVEPQEMEKLVEQFKQSEFIPNSQILFLLHCCGNCTIFLSSQERQKMTDELWSIIKKSVDFLDVSLYNALLQIHLENNKDYDPLEMLSEMEKNNVSPNRVTFDKMIQYCCQKSDIQTATTLLNLMSEKNLPLSKSIFHSLIVGHAQSGDIDYSVNLLEIMRKGGLEPDADTYGALIQAYAIKGDMEKIQEITMECEQKEIHLSDYQFIKVVGTLASNGHLEHIKKIAETIQMTKKFSMEMVIITCQLLEKKQFKNAFELFKVTSNSLDPKLRRNLISFFLDNLLAFDNTLLNEFCKFVKDNYNFSYIHQMSLRRTFFSKNPETALQILKLMQQNGDDIQENYFWPLFSIYRENADVKSLTEAFESMIADFGLNPSLKTITTYFMPFLSGNTGEILSKLRSAGIDKNKAVNAYIYHKLETRNFKSCIYVAKHNPQVALHPMLIIPMTKVLEIYGDAQTFVEFVRYVKENHDNKYTCSDGIELFEEEPENVDFNDFVAMEVVKAIPLYKAEVANQVFNAMVEVGLGISKETAEKIKQFYEENIHPKMVEALDKLSAGNLVHKPVEYSVEAHTQTSFYEFINAQDEKSALVEIQAMKERGQEIFPDMYKKLIKLMLTKEKTDEAKELLNDLIQLNGASELGPMLTMSYAYAVMKKGDVEEAMNFLTQNYKAGELSPANSPNQNSWLEKQIAMEIAKRNDEDLERKYMSLFHDQRRLTRTKRIFQPFIRFHVERQDYVKAIDKFMWIADIHDVLVSERYLLRSLVKAEDAENLQRLTNFLASRKGEVLALYDLALAFMECGKLNQAKKLISTPGLKLNMNLISATAHYYTAQNKLDCIGDLLEITKEAENIDRPTLFESLVNELSLANDWERALQLWVQMQEENLIPTENFLTNLSQLLVKNGQDVPFKTLI